MIWLCRSGAMNKERITLKNRGFRGVRINAPVDVMHQCERNEYSWFTPIENWYTQEPSKHKDAPVWNMGIMTYPNTNIPAKDALIEMIKGWQDEYNMTECVFHFNDGKILSYAELMDE